MKLGIRSCWGKKKKKKKKLLGQGGGLKKLGNLVHQGETSSGDTGDVNT